MGERRQLSGLVFAVVVLLAGVSVTVAVYVQLRLNQRENAEQVMDQRTAVAASAVRTEIARYRGLLEATAAGLAGDRDLTWEDFDAATAPLSTAGLAGASSLAYVAPATTEQIPAVQALWRTRGAEGLALRPLGGVDEHYFTIFTRMLNAVGRPLHGLDLAASREAAEALDLSRRIGRPTVSDAYVLLRDRGLPEAQQQRSFVFAAPLWSRASDPEFRGWIVLGMRSQDFLTGVLATVSQGALDARLLATGSDGSQPAVARYTVPGTPDLARSVPFEVADRDWTLLVDADADRLPGGHSRLPLIVLIAGIVLTGLLAGLVHVLATGRARALLRVQRAVGELSAAEAEARRQAALLGAVMTSIADGVGVVDTRGVFLLHNPAARKLLGVDDLDGGPEEWPQHYGLYLPDGRTPYPVDELPLVRALRGEASDGVEMVVRNATRPEGILLSVDGRPLDASAGLHGAVAVFRDVTDLRRYQHDLSLFAGVVAHDLKAPLAVVHGHCETVTDSLSDRPPDLDEATGAAGRIRIGVDRMGSLIDTLLAYATARDAPLRTTAVDLAPMVAAVAEERTAPLPPADRPDIRIGALATVHADPDMLRHVLDNLIGNAVKYVRPGVPAAIEVYAEPETGGRTRVVVADRGIGIPDADKGAVFESFHRAHAGDGYAGTGLGLAICRRIVERHGGLIGLEDNPGGGTRFSFTLPPAEPEGVPAAVPDQKEEPMSHRDRTSAEEAAVQAALQRALAEREAIQSTWLPGLPVMPAADPPGPGPLPGATVPDREAEDPTAGR